MNREMKHSGIAWIGDIPNQWEVVRHKNVMHKQKDIQESYHKQDIISLTMGGVVVRDLNAGGKMPTSFDGYQHVYPNDLLLCLFDIDVTPRCVGLVKNAGVTSPAYSRFITHSNAYAPYYDYLLRYIDDYKCFLHLSKNLRSSLTETDFGMIHTCLPPLAEQKAIADFLDKKCEEIDELVALQEKIIEELKSYKQSVITETVCKGLNPNAPMKDSGLDWIGNVPSNWTVCKLKHVYTLLNGRAYSDNELLSEGKYKILRVGNLFTSDKWYYSDLELEENKYCKEGDLLYGWSASIGPYLWNDEKVIYHYHIWKVLFTNNRQFAFYQLQALTEAKRRDMHGSAMQHLTMNGMNNSFIAIPPLEEQQEIADYLDRKCSEIDQLISIKQQKIVELKEYKKSLIYEYTTGKKEV